MVAPSGYAQPSGGGGAGGGLLGGGGAGSVLGGLGSFGGGILGMLTAPGGGDKFREKALQIVLALQDPNFDYSKISFPELAMVAEMYPQLYAAVVPQEIQTAADSPEMRAAQERGLARLEQTATEGYSTPERIAGQEAGRTIQQEGTRLRDQALSQLAQRGRAYGGDALQASLAGNQQAMELARGLGADMSRYGADRRAGAAQAAAGLAGGIRGQDLARRQAAVDSINRRNEFIASLGTQANAANAAARERAQGYNVGTRQGLNTQSQLGRYDTNKYNQAYGNQLLQTLWGDQATKAGMTMQQYNMMGLAADQDRAAHIQTYQNAGQGLGQAGGGLLSLGGGFA